MAAEVGVRGRARKGFAPVLVLLAAALFPGNLLAQDLRAAVRGEVERPGEYALDNGARLSDLIAAAGGFTDEAGLPEAVLVRDSEREGQARRLAEAVSAIGGLLSGGSALTVRRESRLAYLFSLRPTGRVPVRLSHPRLLKGTADDIALMDGDDLFIPAGSEEVFVAGAVNTPGMSKVPPGRKYGEYIRAAGGYAENAQRNEVYLFTAEGTTVPLVEPWIRWNEADSRWELSAFRRDRPRIEAGDSIVVPAKPSAPLGEEASGTLFSAIRTIARITGTFVDPP